VVEGRYDLIGPDGDIFLPQLWESSIQPGWNVSMALWPIPEKAQTTKPEEVTKDPAHNSDDGLGFVEVVEDS
jgi:hypothetical protein